MCGGLGYTMFQEKQKDGSWTLIQINCIGCGSKKWE